MAVYSSTFRIRTTATVEADCRAEWDRLFGEGDPISVDVRDDGSVFLWWCDIEATVSPEDARDAVELFHDGWNVGAVVNESDAKSYGRPSMRDVTLLGWSDGASPEQKAAYAAKCGGRHDSLARRQETEAERERRNAPKQRKPAEKTLAYRVGRIIGRIRGRAD